MSAVSPRQFAAFRILFGAYLVVHFALLAPWGTELFSNSGIFPDPAVFPLHGLFPNILAVWDSPRFVAGFLLALILLSGLFLLGVSRRWVAVALWYGLACLFNRNLLISNPSLPYVGLVLLLTAAVPEGEGWSVTRGRSEGWAFPRSALAVGWILLVLGYSYSGWVKLGSPSWVDGSALRHVLENPLARPTLLRDLLLAAPPGLLVLATWGSLALELLSAPLGLLPRARPWLWLALVGMQLGILSMVAFADLTFGMLAVHLFVVDPCWWPAQPSRAGRHLVLFDGVCGLCDRSVQFLLEEDREGVLSFAPLQGSTRAALERRAELPPADQTLVLVRDFGTSNERVLVRSDAILAILATIGGWLAPLALVRAIPRSWRDTVYAFIAGRRYRWFGQLESCRLPAPDVRARFLD